MNWKLKSVLGLFALILATQAMAQVTFYEKENFVAAGSRRTMMLKTLCNTDSTTALPR